MDGSENEEDTGDDNDVPARRRSSDEKEETNNDIGPSWKRGFADDGIWNGDAEFGTQIEDGDSVFDSPDFSSPVHIEILVHGGGGGGDET
ncbi:Hypothetical protein UVM_LOCUS500 [uncultured virus]|nr:Hypothetical protein UVM_LOCUS500 [uncultured virus]